MKDTKSVTLYQKETGTGIILPLHSVVAEDFRWDALNGLTRGGEESNPWRPLTNDAEREAMPAGIILLGTIHDAIGRLEVTVIAKSKTGEIHLGSGWGTVLAWKYAPEPFIPNWPEDEIEPHIGVQRPWGKTSW